jgi:hypothetical protein
MLGFEIAVRPFIGKRVDWISVAKSAPACLVPGKIDASIADSNAGRFREAP